MAILIPTTLQANSASVGGGWHLQGDWMVTVKSTLFPIDLGNTCCGIPVFACLVVLPIGLGSYVACSKYGSAQE